MSMSEWKTININPPPLDAVIVVRTANFCGYGRTHDVTEFDSSVMNQDEVEMYLESMSFVEWMELPE